MMFLWNFFILWSLQLFLSVKSTPKFTIVDETNELIYLSSHGFYRKIPDNETLTYISRLSYENLTRISNHKLQKYRKEMDIIASNQIKNWDDATDRISDKLQVMQDAPHLITSYFLGAFCNPSIVYFQKKFLIAGRRSDWKPVIVFAWLKQKTNLAHFEIDRHSKYLGIGPGITPLTGVIGYDSSGEDPRLFVINDNTLMIIKTDVNQKPFRLRLQYLQYQKNPANQQEEFLLLNDTMLQPPIESHLAHAQKNWSPFLTLQNELRFVYVLHKSLTVVRMKANGQPGDTEIVSEVSNHHNVAKLWEFGQARGGSPAHRIGNTMYLSFFHSQKITPNTGPYWHTMYMGAYIFSNKLPHQLIAMSRVPMMHEGWFQGNWMKAYQTLYVYFAVNFFFIDLRNGQILEDIHEESCETMDCMSNYNVSLSYGFNDVQGYVGMMNLAILYQTMHQFKDPESLVLTDSDINSKK